MDGKLSNATAASITTGAATFNFTGLVGSELDLVIDSSATVVSATQSPLYGGIPVKVVVKAADYAAIGAVTAAELVAVLNRELIAQAAAGQPAAAVAAGTSTVSVKTVRLGQDATIQILPSSSAALLTALTLTAGVTSGTGVVGIGAQPSAPTFFDLMSFTGDASYGTGGFAGFGAAVKAFFKDSRQVLAVIAQDCGGYVVAYVPSTDKLKVFEQSGADDTPLDEVDATTNLSGVTFNVLVISA